MATNKQCAEALLAEILAAKKKTLLERAAIAGLLVEKAAELLVLMAEQLDGHEAAILAMRLDLDNLSDRVDA